MKIRLVGAELFHVDGRTDRQTDGRTDVMKLIVAFRNFTKAMKTYGNVILPIVLYGCKVSPEGVRE